MTTEEKAKAYDEALERAKEMHKANFTDSFTKANLEDLFPTLKESEDERIRKWIIDFARGQIDGFLFVDDEESHRIAEIWKKAIAWLEKQKEQKSAIWTEEDEKNLCELLAYGETRLGLRRWIASLPEKIKGLQQKSVDVKVVYPNHPKRKEIGFYCDKQEVSWEDMPLKVRMHDYPYYFRDGMDYYPFKPEDADAIFTIINGEQKPENVNPRIECDKETDVQKAYREGRTAGIRMVCERPEEYRLQKPAEWSEEDELMRTAVIQTLERFVGYRGTVGMQIDWLKSLRPSWKPSDEQMNAIDFVLRFDKTDGYKEALRSLWMQLNNLI